MCLAIPAKVLEVEENTATVDYGGVKRKAQLDLVEAKPGDYVLIHAGFAIEVMDKETAMESLSQINEMLNENE